MVEEIVSVFRTAALSIQSLNVFLEAYPPAPRFEESP
jgi:hypothetical protein